MEPATAPILVTYEEASNLLGVSIRRLYNLVRASKLRIHGFKQCPYNGKYMKLWSLVELRTLDTEERGKGRAIMVARGHALAQSRKGRTFPRGYPVLPYGPDLPICPVITKPKAQKPPKAPKPPKKPKKAPKVPIVSFEKPTTALIASVLKLRMHGHKAGAIAKLVNEPLARIWPILEGAPKCVNSTVPSAVNHLSSWKKA